MAKCKFCGVAVPVSPVWHTSCYEEAAHELAAQVCDKICKHTEAYDGHDQEEMYEEHCRRCPLELLVRLGVGG